MAGPGDRFVADLAFTPQSILAMLLSVACICSLIMDLPGLAKWIDLQLNPKALDDSATEAPEFQRR